MSKRREVVEIARKIDKHGARGEEDDGHGGVFLHFPSRTHLGLLSKTEITRSESDTPATPATCASIGSLGRLR